MLTDIFADVLRGASSLASIWTRRRYNLSVAFNETEAKNVARPVAKIVQRRTNVRGDLNDAADSAGAVASFFAYVERVASGRGASSPQPDNSSWSRPASPPTPSSAVIGEEPVGTSSPTSRDSARIDASLEPGTGPFRGTFLSGFEEP